MEDVDDDDWAPLFEPTEFNEEHKPLKLEQYKLPEDDLRTWAERCVSIRAAIVEKSKLYQDEVLQVEASNFSSRSRRGNKKSTAEHNVEGLQEKDLKR